MISAFYKALQDTLRSNIEFDYIDIKILSALAHCVPPCPGLVEAAIHWKFALLCAFRIRSAIAQQDTHCPWDN